MAHVAPSTLCALRMLDVSRTEHVRVNGTVCPGGAEQ